jgi:hypothetical protein
MHRLGGMMSIEGERIYSEWAEITGHSISPSSMGTELVDWVLSHGRDATGYRHITHTDREDLARLGYELHPDGGYHRRSSS